MKISQGRNILFGGFSPIKKFRPLAFVIKGGPIRTPLPAQVRGFMFPFQSGMNDLMFHFDSGILGSMSAFQTGILGLMFPFQPGILDSIFPFELLSQVFRLMFPLQAGIVDFVFPVQPGVLESMSGILDICSSSRQMFQKYSSVPFPTSFSTRQTL